MVCCYVSLLFFATKFLIFVQAKKISYPSLALPISVGFVVISVVDRPRELWNRVDDAQEEPKDPIQPCCFEQRSMTAIVHERKTSQRKQAENDQKRWSEPERHVCGLKHQPPQQPIGNQGVRDLKQGLGIAPFAEGLQGEILVCRCSYHC